MNRQYKSVLDALRETPATRKQLADKLGWPVTRAHNALHALRGKSLVARTAVPGRTRKPHHVWFLPGGGTCPDLKPMDLALFEDPNLRYKFTRDGTRGFCTRHKCWATPKFCCACIERDHDLTTVPPAYLLAAIQKIGGVTN